LHHQEYLKVPRVVKIVCLELGNEDGFLSLGGFCACKSPLASGLRPQTRTQQLTSRQTCQILEHEVPSGGESDEPFDMQGLLEAAADE
jgi:hypothetical protein